MTRCVYRNVAMNYSTEPDMHTRKLNIVKKPDTQEKDANKGSRTGFGIDFHHVSLSTIVKKAIKMSMSGQVLDASKLVNQRSIEKEVNSKYGGTPMGTPNSRFDDTPMGTPMSTTNNRQVRNRFQLEFHMVKAVSHQFWKNLIKLFICTFLCHTKMRVAHQVGKPNQTL